MYIFLLKILIFAPTCLPPFPFEQGAQGKLFIFRQMSKVQYLKPPTTYQQQLTQLISRGMTVVNLIKAEHLLESVSYYRLSGYWYPMLADKQNHIFKPGSEFEAAFKLYCFDRKLRHLVISELEKIEVAVRSKMIYIMAHKHGPFWFQDATLFKDPIKHASTLTKIGQEYNRSDEEFIKAFSTKYSDPLPPSWMTMEITSFGTLSVLYGNILPSAEKRQISDYFGVADTVLENWLHNIVYIRNVCAHHSRLWNRAMRITAQLPRKPRKTWLKNTTIRNDRMYFILCMIRYFLQTVNPSSTFSQKVRDLLLQFPTVDPNAMNFPKDWDKEPLWK
jgi:abortive infection bacteriophage resistance protein